MMEEFNNSGFDNTEQTEEAPEPNKKKQKSKLGIGIFLGIIITVAVLLVGAVVCSLLIRKKAAELQTTEIEMDYDEKIQLILGYLNEYFLYDVDEGNIQDSLAKGLMSGLGDKYAAYYAKQEFEDMIETTNGEYAGIGISITMQENGDIVIYKVFNDTPAKEAGLQTRDIIISANGITEFESLDAVSAIVRGEPGTTVDLVIERNGEQLSFTIERRMVKSETVEYKMLDNSIGYISLTQFEIVSVSQFNDAIDALTSQGMESLIIDLRDNPGGDYDTVVAMADRILPKGKILTTRDKKNNEKVEMSDEEHQLKMPIVILINGNSASASELFTGALQDHNWATVVGTQSFGKGIVQSLFRLPDGSGLKFTTNKYFTPNDRDIDGVGITPDVVIDIPDEAYLDGEVTMDEDVQLQKAIEILGGSEE